MNGWVVLQIIQIRILHDFIIGFSKLIFIYQAKYYPNNVHFFFKTTIRSNKFWFKDVLFAVIIFPASENNLSLEVEVAEIHKYFCARFDKIGNFNLYIFHHSNGLASQSIWDSLKYDSSYL